MYTGVKTVCEPVPKQRYLLRIFGKIEPAEVENFGPSQDKVVESKRAVAFVRKVAFGCLSLLLMLSLWLMSAICTQLDLSRSADVLLLYK